MPTSLIDRFQIPRYAAIGKIMPNTFIFLKYQYATEIIERTPKHKNGIVINVSIAEIAVNLTITPNLTYAITIFIATAIRSKTIQSNMDTNNLAHHIAVLFIPPESITPIVFDVRSS
ncbi:hypothetical protein [Ruminococcus flavefaciens]|uniref:hypothetical protein n=1 Tax=Ruminococcus flavefaciens TaxID=1265 RepID=UPI0012BC4731|nr:hypothetical protein [Ruminococcus flavefaciens]